MSQRLRLLAPAKINLHLRVGPPTADGFHPLLSWMCTIGFFDTLILERVSHGNLSPFDTSKRDTQSGRTLSPTGSNSGDAPGSAGAVAPVVSTAGVPAISHPIRLTCDDPNLRCDEGNLIVRAGALLAQAIRQESGGQQGGARQRLPEVAAFLEKKIPMGAGLGGGSSDGARMLLGLNELWAGKMDRERLAALSAKLGSDLPFFCHGPSSICTGRGEIVRQTPAPVARWAVLFLPQIHMPTPAVYKRFDQMSLGDRAAVAAEPDWLEWAKLSAESLLPRLVNDLEAPAFALRPELANLRTGLEGILHRPVRMSGSGSSLFTLFDSEMEAHRASENFSVKFLDEPRNHVSTGTAIECRASVVELAPLLADDLNEPVPAA